MAADDHAPSHGPPPLTPADCDLTDFKFMPLLVGRLRDSDLASEQTPEENWAAVLLWGASWHQVPAASLPDVDATIAKWAGYMMRGKVDARWKEVRKGAMRGFVLCADGRWYHPVVAEVAREAWTGKLKQRLKTECNRIKKHNERHGTRIQFPDFETWLSLGCPVGQPLPVPGDTPPLSPGHHPSVPSETPSKGQGEGQGKGQGQGKDTHGAGAQAPPADEPPGQRVSKVAAIVLAMKAEGIGECNPGHPKLAQLLEEGAEVQNFVSAAQAAVGKHKGFAYALGVVQGQMAEARSLAAAGRATVPRNGHSGSTARAARMAEAVPNLVANGHAPPDFIDTEVSDVTPRRLG